MAEIKIEKKKPVWPWIILILLLIGILVYFFVFMDNKELAKEYNGLIPETDIPEVIDSVNYNGSPTTSSYLGAKREVGKYMGMIRDKARLGNDQEFTRTALMQLKNAVQTSLQEKNIQIPFDQNTYSSEGENSIPDSIKLSMDIKKTGEQITSALEAGQELPFPGLGQETQEVKNSISRIDSNLEISKQQEEIVAFFDKCGNLLKKMDQEN